MIQLKDTKSDSTANLIASAIRTAEYYGFLPFDAITRSKTSAPGTARKDEKQIAQSARIVLGAIKPPIETPLLWRLAKYPAGGRFPAPHMSLELHVLGVPSAISEALLIVVTHAIAEEIGMERKLLTINSIGSLESSNRFVRDVGHFLRRHLDSIAPALRPRAAQDPLGTLIQLFEKGHPAMSRAPQSVEYLTEEERRRFWDLLEYLEISGVPYELSPSVLGSRDFWSHTLFELSTFDPETRARMPFASGGRYDPLAAKITGANMPAAMVNILAEIRGKSAVKPERRISPLLYFAHLGPEARRRALPVLEQLRRAGIPVEQSLMHDRLHEQMEKAKKMAISHMLIMGHKEAIEGTVLVREVATNSQEAIPLPDLTTYLRRQRVYA